MRNYGGFLFPFFEDGVVKSSTMKISNTSKSISDQFLKLDLFDFFAAAEYVKNLPYKRNSQKDNPLCVFQDSGGTCSTKHALLKRLADENSFEELKLMLGIFKMNGSNTRKITPILEKYSLKEIPEAHNYLKIENQIFDFTRKNSKPEDFINDLIEEIQIQPEQIIDFKIKYHKNFLKKYLKENPQIPYNLDEFWKIREECIAELQK